MRAVAVTPGVSGSVEVVDVATPEPGDGEVLIRTSRVGICGTDLEIAAAEYGQAPAGEPRLILGHEAIGEVVKLGSGAHKLQPGDFVVSTVRRPCPHDSCEPCRSNSSDMCVTGDFVERGIGGAHGFNAEYFVENERWLTPIPATLSDVGVLLEPLTVVEKALRHTDAIQSRLPWRLESAAVLGAGAIGLLGAALLRLRDVDTYVANRTESDSPKSRLIRAIGANHINVSDARLEGAISKSGGFDLVLEATGYTPLIFDAIQTLSLNGVICLLGVSGGSRNIEFDADRFNQSMVLGNRTMFGSVNAHIEDFRSGVEHLRQIEARWPGWLSSLITRRVQIDDYKEAFLRQSDDIKVTIEYHA